MRILVFGAGVLGCNIAADLFKAGMDVTLLARGQWYETIRSHGLLIKGKFSFWTRTWPVPVIDHLAENDVYDVIFVSLRYTQLESVVELLGNNLSNTIIFNGNNSTASEFAAMFPHKRVLFSFAEVGGNRDGERVNSFNLHKMTIGGLTESDEDRLLIEKVFSGTKIRLVYEPNMNDYLLSHAAFVVPICFACYHADGYLKRIMNDKAYIHRIIDANIECYTALEKLGHIILPAADQAYRTQRWRRLTFLFYRLMASCSLGKLVASDHALSAVDEMAALSAAMEKILRQACTSSAAFDELKQDMRKYLKK